MASSTLALSCLQAAPAFAASQPLVKAKPPTAAPDATSRPDAASALSAARRLGHQIEVSSMGTDKSTTWVNPDGSRTLKATAGVTRWQDSAGVWHDIDTTLTAQQDGSLQPASVSPHRGIVVPSRADAGVRVTTDAGVFVLSHPGAAPAVVGHKGNRGLFSKALGGRDVADDATPSGLEETVILANKSQSGSYTDHLTVPTGVIAHQSGDNVSFVDSRGAAVSSFGGGAARDSLVSASGDPATTAVAAHLVSQDGTSVVISVSVDPAWLASPARIFPVTIDPLLYNNTAVNGQDWWAETDNTSKGLLDPNLLRIGYGFGTQANALARSELQFDLSGAPMYSGALVSNAYLRINNMASSAVCSSRNVSVYLSGLASYQYGTSMPDKDSAGVVSATPVAGCAPGWINLDATSLAQRWFAGVPETGIVLQSSEVHADGWKKFYSGTSGTNSAPALYLTWYYPEGTPAAGCLNCRGDGVSTPQTQPSLFGEALVPPDSDPVTYQFQVMHTGGGTAAASGPIGPNGTDQSTGLADATWTVPALPDGSYQYAVTVSDAHTSASSAWATIVVDTVAPAAPAVTASAYVNNQTLPAAPSANTFTFVGPSDATAFAYAEDPPSVDSATWATVPAAGAQATLSWNPGAGPHRLWVASQDGAGNTSSVVEFDFGVATTDIIQPVQQARSSQYFPVSATGPAGATNGSLQYQASGLPDWSHASTASPSALRVGLNQWDGSLTAAGSGVSTPTGLVWDASALAAGAVDMRFCYIVSSVPLCSAAHTVQKLQHAFGGVFGTAPAGPGQVSLSTGELQVTATDASVPGASGSEGVTRTSLSLAGAPTVPGAFGPAWSDALPTTSAGAMAAQLKDNSSIDGTISVAYPDGETDVFFRADKQAGAYAPQGDTASTGKSFSIASNLLSETLSDADGTVTTWSRADLSTGWVTPPTVTLPGGKVSSSIGSGTYTADDTNSPRGYTSGDTWRQLVTQDAALGSNCATGLVAGCRGLTVVIASPSTVAPTGTNLGNYPGRAKDVLLTVWDPTANSGAGAMTSRIVAQYTYDSAGYLRQTWDPRADVTAGSHLITSYTYLNGQLKTLAPPGLQQWTFGYTLSATNVSQLTAITRYDPVKAAYAITRVAYNVPMSGTGLPTMTAAGTALWGQPAAGNPTTGTAVFPATWSPSIPPVASDWPYASITYLDPTGRATNTASYGAGAWQVASKSYDSADNTLWSLTPENRNEVILGSAAKHTASAVAGLSAASDRAELLGTVSVPSASDPALLLDTYGPAHSVTLADGSTQVARAHTHTTYDEGAPSVVVAGSQTYKAPFRLATTVTSSALVISATTPTLPSTGVDRDVHTTTLSYDPLATGDGSGWALHKPITTAEDPAGLRVWHASRYDLEGNIVEAANPDAAMVSGVGIDAHSTDTLYYVSGSSSPDSACNGKPQWTGLVCRVGPASQPAGTPLPVMRVTAYNYLLQPLTETDTSGSVVRTTTTTYDAAGRTRTSAVAVAGPTAPTPVHAKVQFEPPGAPVVSGYTSDDGEPYTASLGRGWVRQDSLSGTHTPLDLSQPGAQQSGVSWGNTRERNRSGISALQNTLIHLQYADSAPTAPGQTIPGAFEYAVPNGRYTVTVSVGDQAYNSVHTINVEGVTAIDHFVPTSTTEYKVATVTVNVADGKLTIDALNGINTKLNYVTIDSAAANSNVAVPTETTGYNASTGLATSTTTGSSSVSTVFDSWGRVSSSTNATGDVSTTTYDLGSRPTTMNDSKGTYTYTYDGTDSLGKVEHRGLMTKVDTGMGTLASAFTGAYNGDGTLISEVYPTAITATTSVDDVAASTGLTYTKSDGSLTGMTFSAGRDVLGRLVRQSSPLSAQTYAYDAAGRLSSAIDHPNGPTCTSRAYGYNASADRTSLAVVSYPSTGAACGTPPAGTTVTHSYDSADRDTDPGYTYDELGRTLTVPAADANGTLAALSYNSNDMVASQTAGTHTKTWTTDAADRLLASSDVNIANGGSSTLVTTNHYAGGGDSPAWIALSGTSTSWTRNVTGLGGALAAIQSSDGTAALQLTNLHGDVVATASDTTTATGTTSMFESTEFGAPRAVTTAPRYGWLGADERSADSPGGLVLMGERMYNPSSGRFLSVDPVPGGSSNAYDYCNEDPLNCTDLDGTMWWWVKVALNGLITAATIAAKTLCAGTGPSFLICIGAVGGLSAAATYFVNAKHKSAEGLAIAVAAGVAAAGLGNWAYAKIGQFLSNTAIGVRILALMTRIPKIGPLIADLTKKGGMFGP